MGILKTIGNRIKYWYFIEDFAKIIEKVDSIGRLDDQLLCKSNYESQLYKSIPKNIDANRAHKAIKALENIDTKDLILILNDFLKNYKNEQIQNYKFEILESKINLCLKSKQYAYFEFYSKQNAMINNISDYFNDEFSYRKAVIIYTYLSNNLDISNISYLKEQDLLKFLSDHLIYDDTLDKIFKIDYDKLLYIIDNNNKTLKFNIFDDEYDDIRYLPLDNFEIIYEKIQSKNYNIFSSYNEEVLSPDEIAIIRKFGNAKKEVFDLVVNGFKENPEAFSLDNRLNFYKLIENLTDGKEKEEIEKAKEMFIRFFDQIDSDEINDYYNIILTEDFINSDNKEELLKFLNTKFSIETKRKTLNESNLCNVKLPKDYDISLEEENIVPKIIKYFTTYIYLEESEEEKEKDFQFLMENEEVKEERVDLLLSHQYATSKYKNEIFNLMNNIVTKEDAQKFKQMLNNIYSSNISDKAKEELLKHLPGNAKTFVNDDYEITIAGIDEKVTGKEYTIIDSGMKIKIKKR